MALQLAKYKPLEDLVVQGNNYQAGNISQPSPGVTPVNITLPAPAPSYTPRVVNRTPTISAPVSRNTAANRSFLDKLVHFGPSAVADISLNDIRNAAVGTGRSIARIPETASRSWIQLTGGQPQSAPPATDPVRRFLYGSEPLQTYQKRSEGIHKAHPNIPAPVAALGLAAADLYPGGKGRVPKVRAPGEVNAALDAAATASKTKYTKPSVVRRFETSVANPTAPLARIDQTQAKAIGTNAGDYRALPANQRLEHLADVAGASSTAGRQTDLHLQQFGVDKVIQKYGEGTAAGKEFRNYQNAKFALEVAQKRNLKILTDEAGKKIAPVELANFVKDYEARNPRAIADNLAFKNASDAWLEKAVGAGLIDRKTADYVKGTYQHYVPINRVFPDNLERPTVNASPRGTVGRQSVIQSLEGSSIPVDNSFNTFIQRGRAVQGQINRNNLFNLYRQRVETGAAPGTVVQTAEQVARRQELKQSLAEMSNVRSTLKSQISRQRSKAPLAGYKARTAEAAVATKMRAILSKQVTDPNAASAIPSLSKADLTDIYRTLTDTGNQKSGKMITDRLRAKLESTSAAHAQLMDEITNMKADLQSLNSGIKTVRHEALSLQTDSLTGKQVISGYQDGLPVKIEVPPEIAKVMQGLDQEKLNALLRVVGGVMRPFRSTFTGLFNPIFSGLSFAFYDAPIAVLNSPNGWRTLASPRAMGEMFKSFKSDANFQKALGEHGAQMITGSLSPVNAQTSARFIASRANLGSKIKYAINPRNLKDISERLDVLGGKLSGATRTRIAKTAYDDAIRHNLSPEDAMANATYMYNNIMPNYQRAASIIRQIDQIIPYTSASIAGTRALGIAVRRSPAKSLTKAAILISPGIAIVAHNMSQPQGDAFYADMEESGKQTMLQNNWIIMLPGSKKDPKTGQWSNIIKIPVPPEFRGLNRLVYKQTRSEINGNGLASPTVYAQALADTATGQTIPTSLDKQGLQRINNPAANIAVGLSTNVNPTTGTDITYESAGKSPTRQKLEFVAGNFGAAGQIASGKGTPLSIAKARVSGAKGLTEGGQYFKDSETAAATVGLNDSEKAAWKSIHPTKTTKKGDILVETTPIDTAQKADTYIRYPKVLEADKLANNLQVKRGKPSNPFFDETPGHQRVLLAIQSLSHAPGNSDAAVLTQDNKSWLDPYYTKTGLYFDAVKSTMTKEDQAKLNNGISGLPPKPVADTSLQRKLDAGAAITDPAQKRQYYANNPDVTDFFAKSDSYNRAKRAWVGFEQFDPYPTPSPATQKLMDFYNNLPHHEGPGGKSPTRSAWIKAHPAEWATIGNQYDQIAQYSLQQDMKIAQYQGHDLSDKSLATIGGGSSSSSSSRSSFSRFSYNNRPRTAGSAYKYAIPLSAGGAVAKPKVSISVGKGKAKIAKSSSGKAKVSIKKSLV